ncbi:hypothetical protein H6G89_30830 [Oscillatoria sp. FACHB-1407]|uniref:hypothetical protein n=1 Tax=Oscillatoria sp. FACHB-1407 TaxID=2692847 RepID=UPI001686B769|nr:hypothetical protein [Oscillatoria sp. FACHB-1407]MBD2465405.1 hypothetical protein [Oscillatoria sp. FACHB-1407]
MLLATFKRLRLSFAIVVIAIARTLELNCSFYPPFRRYVLSFVDQVTPQNPQPDVTRANLAGNHGISRCAWIDVGSAALAASAVVSNRGA